MNIDQEPKVEAKEQVESIEKNATVKKYSGIFAEFLVQFEEEAQSEERIRLAMNFMRSAISQSGTPRFRDFWETRRLCLPLFKENLNPKVRVLLWGEYVELSGEARRIKEILDEQSAFASEQIDLAIAALEGDLDQFHTLLDQASMPLIPENCIALQQNKELFSSQQSELNLLNAMASRVNALRKEVIKTEMRVRFKNRFFDRLSTCGDRIFPRRKELIKEISDLFKADVTAFIETNFNADGRQSIPLYILRDEIKLLQSMAKDLTLNTQAFTETRLQLSQSWDLLRERDKERKRDFSQKKQVYKQNYDQIIEKVSAFAEVCRNDELSHEVFMEQGGEISEMIQTLELGKEEARALREELQKAKQPVLDKLQEKEEERQRVEREEEAKRREALDSLKDSLSQLLEKSSEMEVQTIIEQRDEFLQESEKLSLNKVEKHGFDKLFRSIKDLINEKREKAIMALSPDDQEALDKLKNLLAERKQQRQEIREQLEAYRKTLGGSSLDIEKSMAYGELVDAEKLRLEKANVAIQEIEGKIFEIES